MAETLTQSGLATMAGQMPVRNKEIAEQQKAARMIQLQQSIAGLKTGQAPTPMQAQQMGATMAGQAGAEEVGRAKQMVQTASQLGKLGQRETEMAAQQELGALRGQAQQEQLTQASRLAALDDSAKREMFDSELQFKKDQANNTLFTERQLADYARLNATKNEDFKKWSQQAEQMHRRNVAVLETVNAKIEEAINFEYQKGKQKMDQETMKQLAEAKRQNDIQLAKARARAQNTAAAWGALGTAVSTTGAVLTGTGLGAAVGVPLIVAGAGISYMGGQEAAKKGGA